MWYVVWVGEEELFAVGTRMISIWEGSFEGVFDALIVCLCELLRT
jgi:hypothetical protein